MEISEYSVIASFFGMLFIVYLRGKYTHLSRTEDISHWICGALSVFNLSMAFYVMT